MERASIIEIIYCYSKVMSRMNIYLEICSIAGCCVNEISKKVRKYYLWLFQICIDIIFWCCGSGTFAIGIIVNISGGSEHMAAKQYKRLRGGREAQGLRA